MNKNSLISKMVIGLAVVASLSACTATERGASIGTVGGAIVGGAVTGNVRGAAVGAALGGVGGAVVGHMNEPQPELCYYRDRYGNRYSDYC
jgi:hypothetical protein